MSSASLPGLGLIFLIGAAATLAAGLGLAAHGFSALSIAIAIGVVLGNLWPRLVAAPMQPGLRIAQRNFLRLGVALFGFNLSVQQILHIGMSGLVADLCVVAGILALGYVAGTRWLGLDRETALLTSAGSAICGAAAVVATVPMLRMDEESAAEKTAIAVATVVLFGTLSMLLYPLLREFVWHGHGGFGVYVGSTVHEVAQVVAIGNSLGGDVARDGVVVKMMRVLLLVPFLLLVDYRIARSQPDGERGRISVPWFAFGFAACAAVNSLQILPTVLVDGLRQAASLLLTGAMAALGLETTLARMRHAGPRPLLLAALLFACLTVGGGLLNWWLAA
jgi:uncharacterized integral membrane protein (TIGR00698 family)